MPWKNVSFLFLLIFFYQSFLCFVLLIAEVGNSFLLWALLSMNDWKFLLFYIYLSFSLPFCLASYQFISKFQFKSSSKSCIGFSHIALNFTIFLFLNYQGKKHNQDNFGTLKNWIEHLSKKHRIELLMIWLRNHVSVMYLKYPS